MTAHQRRLDLRELVSDERGYLSSARIGMWTTMAILAVCVGVDIGMTIQRSHSHLPNVVYSTLGTMFVAFAGWAAGSKYATAWGRLGEIGQGIGASNITAALDGVTERTDFVAHNWRSGAPDEGRL